MSDLPHKLPFPWSVKGETLLSIGSKDEMGITVSAVPGGYHCELCHSEFIDGDPLETATVSSWSEVVELPGLWQDTIVTHLHGY